MEEVLKLQVLHQPHSCFLHSGLLETINSVRRA